MMASDFIIDVTEADFEYQVLGYSKQIPVVVDFWAEWCSPCRTLGPLLENLAQEAQGAFRLAKLNVDQNPNLALRYGVHGIPIIKAFRNEEIVAELIGAQPEPRLREFLRQIAPSQSDLMLEKGLSLLDAGEIRQAEPVFRQVLKSTPESAPAQLGLAKCLLLLNQGEAARKLLAGFPANRQYKTAQALLPLAQALARPEDGAHYETSNPLDAAFDNALRLVRRGNIEAAMDGLLDILREDKHYRDGEARRTMIALLELLGDNSPLARQYRNELASVLF
ncbi:MAG: tetratricopeptide repeat protein [Anaerolineales bacterium]|nr:tetratricopeptide repeat protein [Anaerolineales bacterium]